MLYSSKKESYMFDITDINNRKLLCVVTYLSGVIIIIISQQNNTSYLDQYVFFLEVIRRQP